MKKIFTLLLIMLLSVPLCLADEPQEEDIDSFFTDETESSEPLQGYLEYTTQDQEPENAVYLEDPIFKNSLNLKSPQKVSSKSVPKSAKQLPSFEPGKFELASKFSTQEYEINPVSTGYITKRGNFSFGTTYDASIDTAETNHSSSIFTKYEWKHFALKTAISKNTKGSLDSFNDKFYIVPELKLTKNLSLLDVMQTDVAQINKKNKVVLRYTPHFKKYADEVQFELGAGQTYREDNYINSSVEFSTKFKL